MITKTATPVANIEPTEAGDLSTRGDSASFFRVTPAKGTRVDGTVAVGMTSHELDAAHGKPYSGKVSHPAMWVDFTPMYEDARRYAHAGTTRMPITINGRAYGAAMFEDVSGSVECYPLAQYPHLADYGYPRVTVGGIGYVLRFRLSMFDSVTDSAHRLLEAVANEIAVGYLTDVRWAGYRANVAKRAASSAADALNEAQEKYDAAREAMIAAQNAYDIALEAEARS